VGSLKAYQQTLQWNRKMRYKPVQSKESVTFLQVIFVALYCTSLDQSQGLVWSLYLDQSQVVVWSLYLDQSRVWMWSQYLDQSRGLVWSHYLDQSQGLVWSQYLDQSQGLDVINIFRLIKRFCVITKFE